MMEGKKKKKKANKKWLGSSRMSSRKAQNVSFEFTLPCLHKTWRTAWAWLWNVHKSICKDSLVIIITTGSSKFHRKASLNTTVHRQVLWNLLGSVLPESQEQPAAEMVPFWLQGTRSSPWCRESSHPAAQPTCGVGDTGQKLSTTVLCLVCTPHIKAVITQMQNSLLPNSRLHKWLYKWLGEQEEALRESQGRTASLRMVTGREGLQGKRTPQVEHRAVR